MHSSIAKWRTTYIVTSKYPTIYHTIVGISYLFVIALTFLYWFIQFYLSLTYRWSVSIVTSSTAKNITTDNSVFQINCCLTIDICLIAATINIENGTSAFVFNIYCGCLIYSRLITAAKHATDRRTFNCLSLYKSVITYGKIGMSNLTKTCQVLSSINILMFVRFLYARLIVR